jgi:predicted neuraminidase
MRRPSSWIAVGMERKNYRKIFLVDKYEHAGSRDSMLNARHDELLTDFRGSNDLGITAYDWLRPIYGTAEYYGQNRLGRVRLISLLSFFVDFFRDGQSKSFALRQLMTTESFVHLSPRTAKLLRETRHPCDRVLSE